MNWNVMLNVVMSALFFAPLLIALAAFLFIGGLMAIEGLATLVGRRAAELDATVAPPVAGPVVEGLKNAIATDAAAPAIEEARDDAANG